MMKCLECDYEIEIKDDINTENQLKGKEKTKLGFHIKKIHNKTVKEYLIENFFDNKHPLCKCGCKEEVKYGKWNFNKYVRDHKNRMPSSKESIKKGLITKYKNGTLENRLKKLHIKESEIKEYYNNYINFKICLSDISDETGIDSRTIKKYWKELKLIDNLEIFKRISKKHQGLWINTIKQPKIDDYNIILKKLPDIYKFIQQKRCTLGEIIKLFDLKSKPNILYKILIDEYGCDDIDKKIKFHNSSYAEIEFYNVLKYYYNNKIHRQFKLENKYYDYILDNKILIEYDGGYWHDRDKTGILNDNDKLKNEIALRNNYIIIRIKESECRDLESLIRIKKIYDKFKKI